MRMNRLRLVLPAFAALALSFGLAACGDDDEGDGTTADITGGEETLELTIGQLVPLTGDLADFGPPGEKAGNLAVDEINAAVEEVGADHTVEIVTEDDQTTEQGGISAAQKVIADGASCIAGSWASSVTIPVAESVATREGVMMISPASTSAEITALDDDGLINRTPPADNLQGPALAGLVNDELGEGSTVNIGARNDPYGEGLSESFTETFEELGGTVGETVLYDPEQATYNTEAQQITSGNPDGFVIIDFPETYLKVGPALVRTGNFDASKAFLTDGLATSDFPEAGPEATEGFRGTAPGTPEQGEASEAFDELFTTSEPANIDRQTFDGQNFDAVILCYLAAVAAGSTEGEDMAEVLQAVTGPGGEKYTWEQLPDAIEALQNGEDIDYVGAAGEIDLDENGDPTEGVYDRLRFENKEFTPFGEQIDTTELTAAG